MFLESQAIMKKKNRCGGRACAILENSEKGEFCSRNLRLMFYLHNYSPCAGYCTFPLGFHGGSTGRLAAEVPVSVPSVPVTSHSATTSAVPSCWAAAIATTTIAVIQTVQCIVPVIRKHRTSKEAFTLKGIIQKNQNTIKSPHSNALIFI